jgi:tetratricopeptide (TPR) repeat protein
MPDKDDRLQSWKEIASALNREVRTVQMWEKHEGLPVHRHFHSRRSTVFAFRSEIESWAKRRTAIAASARAAADFAQPPQAAAHPPGQMNQSLWLDAVLTGRGRTGMVRSPRLDAREAYFKGRYFWNRRNEPDLRKALQCFRTAAATDPECALAYTGIADTLTLLSFYEIVPSTEAMPQARDAAIRAIELEPNLAEAHTSLADVHLHFDWRWDAAGREYRRAIECNPGYALGYHWYANLLAATGQHDAAYAAVMRALEIEPVSLSIQVWAGVTSYLARRYEDAVHHYRQALELDPDFAVAHMYMAQALEQLGRYSEALTSFDTAIRLTGASSNLIAMKAHAHALAGDALMARDLLNQLQSPAAGKCLPSYDIAATYAALADNASAVHWLERARHERNMKLFLVSQDPRFDPLRGRSDFNAIVQQLGLARTGNAPSLASTAH